jgi:peptidoglycan/LPS O-acetylase OafA/YrhL
VTIAALATLGYRLDLISSFMFQTLAFPSAVLGLAFLQTLRPKAGRAVRLIGDLTYASYLLHFPIQLFMILVIRALGLTVDFTTIVMLVIYLVTVVGLAIPVHFGFELPAQSWLRRRMLGPPRR